MPKNKDSKKTIYVLYIPGGGLLNIMPALMISRLEQLTDKRAAELFQAVEGLSAGSKLAGALNMPGFTGNAAASLFHKYGSKILPETPGRNVRMILTNTMNFLTDQLGLDPAALDRRRIRILRKQCEHLRNATDKSLHTTIDQIENRVSQRWLTWGMHHKVLRDSETICENSNGNNVRQICERLAGLMSDRQHNSHLSAIFKQFALSGINLLKSEDYLFDAKIQAEYYRTFFGQTRLSDARISTYISAYDPKNREVLTASCRKKDFFSLDGKNAEVQHDLAFWDAIMASSAHPLAVVPHETENGDLCIDKAILHAPLTAINDVLAHKPDDADVKLVILGTGHFLSHEVDDDELSAEEENEIYKEHYRRYGLLGNLASMQELEEADEYTTNQALRSIRNRIGDDNVIELSPRLTPITQAEKETFPSRDVLDSSPENLRKISELAINYIRENDNAFRELAQELVDNAYIIGRIPAAEHARITSRIGLARSKPGVELNRRIDITHNHHRSYSNHYGQWLNQFMRKLKPGQSKRTYSKGSPSPE